jgi:hypothetical protein
MANQPSMNGLNARTYRKTEFRVGGVVLIEESRRDHRRTVSSPPRRHELPIMVVSYDNIDDLGHSELHLNVQPVKVKGDPTEYHVTGLGKPIRRLKQRPVVIHTPVPNRVSSAADLAKDSRKSDNQAPPPTPRIQRLPTPELSDLEESPFCDCCGGEHLTSRHKHSVSCRTNLTTSS